MSQPATSQRQKEVNMNYISFNNNQFSHAANLYYVQVKGICN